MQGQAGAEFLDHVGFRLEIKVHLHGRGPEHHIKPERTDLGHVISHDLVPPLRHPVDVIAFGGRMEADADKAHAEIFPDAFNLVEMLMHLAAGLVNRLELSAGKFHLPTGLQRDRTTVFMGKCDRVTVFENWPPAEPPHAGQQRPNSPIALIGNRAQRPELKHEFFMLRANSPIFRLAASRLNIICQL